MRLFDFRLYLSLALLSCLSLAGQTTQGLISGRITNSLNGRPVAGAQVICFNPALSFTASARTGESGYYYLPQLSPGTYQVQLAADGYQAQEAHELDLPVAGRLQLDFHLRPLSDVWEAGQYRSVYLPGSKVVLTFFGPDVDSSHSTLVQTNAGIKGALESTISQVVDPGQISDLPEAGRDVYTMLVTQPGVTADTTTARSLGLSTNGQRPSASNFLLDGLEANNYLVTGPLSPIAPEAIQEYRVSTNNYSAEYGRTSGYIANAVTRAGNNAWHGIGYFDLKNEALNANDFQSNLAGRRRTPLKEYQPGFQVGGPIRRNTLFISLSYDLLRSRSVGPTRSYLLPTTRFLASTAPDSIARKLLTEFPGPVLEGPGLNARYNVVPPVSVDRSVGLARVDRLFSGGAHRLMGRYAETSTSRPDFEWSPYKNFVSGMDERTRSLALTFSSSVRPGLTNELRFGNTVDDLNVDRPHKDIPVLTSSDGTLLPSSPAGGVVTLYSWFTNRIQSWEGLDNLTWAHGRQIVTAGGGVLIRTISGALTAGAEGQYNFANITDFGADRPNGFRIPLDRQDLPAFVSPRFDREYRSNEFFLFLQDTFRLTSRLVLNYGVRYESFGAPQNTGAVKDALVELGPGSSFAARLASASLVRPSSGNETLYAADRNDFAIRLGFSYSLFRRAGTTMRGAYGTFYDRPFDNIWQNLRNNDWVLPSGFPITSPTTNYLLPISAVIGTYQAQPVSTRFPDPFNQSSRAPITMFQPGFRTPYTQSFFYGLQQPLGSSWSAEASYLGSLGRKLITDDVVNRTNATPLEWIHYRSNQGTSSYNALSAVLRYRGNGRQFQASYTWSHTIDNQSDVLSGDYFNLNPTRLTSLPNSSIISAFSREFDSSGDRANSDFDQRQNLIFFSILDLPKVQSSSALALLFRDWKFSQMAAFRSGAPFTVYATTPGQTAILNQRADLVNPSVLYAGSAAVVGGQRLINAAAFAAPPPGRVGNTGRNAFRAPGFYNLDLSLSRSFRLKLLGEGGRIALRADAFNFLNHANLNIPGTTLITQRGFGASQYGRAAADSGLPVLSPVNDTSRQIQLIFRIEF